MDFGKEVSGSTSFFEELDRQSNKAQEKFVSESRVGIVMATLTKILNIPVSLVVGFVVAMWLSEFTHKSGKLMIVGVLGCVMLFSFITKQIYKSLIKKIRNYYPEVKSFSNTGTVCDNNNHKLYLSTDTSEISSETEDSFVCDFDGKWVTMNEFRLIAGKGKEAVSVFEGEAYQLKHNRELQHTILIDMGLGIANSNGLFEVSDSDYLLENLCDKYSVSVSDVRALAEWNVGDKIEQFQGIVNGILGNGAQRMAVRIDNQAVTLIYPASTETFDSKISDLNFARLVRRDFQHVSNLLNVARAIIVLDDFQETPDAADDKKLNDTLSAEAAAEMQKREEEKAAREARRAEAEARGEATDFVHKKPSWGRKK